MNTSLPIDYIVGSCGTTLVTTRNKLEAVDVFTNAVGPYVVLYQRTGSQLLTLHRKIRGINHE